MTRIIFLALLTSFYSFSAFAQNDRKWSLYAGLGGVNMMENRYDDGHLYVPEDQGNTFQLSADYWLSGRMALNGGLYLEQQGLFTYYSEGIGLKTVNMFGVNAGAKYYFFPKKWIFQPHIGADIYTNVLNLGRRKGQWRVTAEQGYPGSQAVMSYDVQCPAISLSPRIGVDIHVLSSLSVCIDYDYRIGLWGGSKAQMRFADGVLTGQTVGMDERNIRSCISVGLKMDFPVRPISEKAQNNLLWLIYSWIASNSR